MKKIPSRTEPELQELHPCELNEDFMARLTACADGTALELTREEIAFEQGLRAVKPNEIPRSLGSTLDDLVRDTPFPVDEKIVLFHKSSTQKPAPRLSTFRRLARSNFAAAAAVAILGAFVALMLPAQNSRDSQVTGAPPKIAPKAISSPIAPVDQRFAPASYQRNLSDTRDEGVIWRTQNQPQRVLRFKYMDKLMLENENGEAVQVEQPREEIVIIPEMLD